MVFVQLDATTEKKERGGLEGGRDGKEVKAWSNEALERAIESSGTWVL